MTDKIKIAFDGPASSGKSAVSRKVAQKLSYLYIDTGAMYRALTWLVLKKNIPVDENQAITLLAENNPVTLEVADNQQGYRVKIDGTDITEEVTSEAVNENVSQVAAISGVRRVMARRQAEMAKEGGVVMAGRDITTVVIPDAELKIYLDASIEERARRRHREFIQNGKGISYDEVLKNLRERDSTDSQRRDSPLIIADDAVIIDSTEMTLTEVVDKVLKMVENYVK